MKLATFEITDFQCIRKSNTIQADDITCLVGKNESGKTALLTALYRLNPIIAADGKYDVTDDYPRSAVEDYNQAVEAGETSPAIVATATFSLAREEIQPIEEEFAKGVLESSHLTLRKGYEGKLTISLDINDRVAVQSVIASAQLPKELAKHFASTSTFSDLKAACQERQEKTEQSETEYISQLMAILNKIEEAGGLQLYIYKTHLINLVPKFLYFDQFFLMTGSENIDALIERTKSDDLKKSDYPLLGLIALARIKLEELLDPQRTQWLLNKLEGASNHLSKKILDYWSQNKNLLIRFDVRPARPGDPEGMTEGTNIWAQVYDSKRMVSTVLGTRSRGFVWFFSFLAWFDQQQRQRIPLILLLDEPALFLHGRAQADLLSYIEQELKESHQVIYTTHSPFMVDTKKYERVRIVQDKSVDSDKTLPLELDGTKVIIDVLEATEDSLFPLQGALGYDIYQTLFVGPNSLVVEGVSDLLYLQTMSALLDSLGKTPLSEKWTITPVGGADKVPTFVALLGAQHGMKIATLLDIQKKVSKL